jgi:hypothetical protein
VRDLNGTHKTIIIVAFLAAIVGLSYLGNDTAALVAVGTAILAGLGIAVAQGNQTIQQTNGALKAKDEAFQAIVKDTQKHMREMADMLAKMSPPTKD